jgi:hypothetical protein
MSTSYTTSPPLRLHSGNGTAFTLKYEWCEIVNFAGTNAEQLCVELCNIFATQHICKLFDLLNNVMKYAGKFCKELIIFYQEERRSRVSSGSIVPDYGLDGRAIGVRSPAGAEDFSSILCVQTGSGAHPASCTMGTGGPFPGGKTRPGRDADHLPHLVPRS